METICIDSDVLIGVLRNNKDAVERIKKLEADNCILATTVINAFELYYGAYLSKNCSENKDAARKLIERLSMLSLTEFTAEECGKTMADLEKRGTPIEIRDLFIGVIAASYGYSLLTGNKAHFKNIPNLTVI